MSTQFEQAGNLIWLTKGRVPQKLSSESSSAIPYVTPNYLRGLAEPTDFFSPTERDVKLNGGEAVILCDGSNAGEVFRGRHGLLASTMAVVQANPQKVDTGFLYVFLKFYETYLKSQTAGSGIPHLDKQLLGRLPFPKISVSEQKRIALIVSHLDTLITHTEGLIKKHERIRAGLLHDLLTRGVDEQGRLRSEETHKFKDSPLGRIPVEWEVSTIDKITSLVGSGVTPTGGSTIYLNEGVVFLRSQNVYNDGLMLEDVAYISEAIDGRMKRSRVHAFDVLLNITGASIGRSCFVPGDFPRANVNQHVCIIRQKVAGLEDAVYLSTVIASPIGQQQINMVNAGGNREGLNYKQIRSFLLPLPSPTERKIIAQKLLQSNRLAEQQQEKLTKFKALKVGLMHDLLTPPQASAATVITE